jgi:hypothetical protein
MFVGFIAVVVILLVIVGLMSSGSTSGSGGVDQTKATKVLTEISALAQSAGFYQTTTADSDYAGMNLASLQTAGIVATDDVVAVAGGDADDPASGTVNGFLIDDTGADTAEAAIGDGVELVKSKAVKGLYYDLLESPVTSTNFIISTNVAASDVPVASSLAKALESSYAKLDKGGVPLDNVAGDPTRTTGSVLDDGEIVAAFK